MEIPLVNVARGMTVVLAVGASKEEIECLSGFGSGLWTQESPEHP